LGNKQPFRWQRRFVPSSPARRYSSRIISGYTPASLIHRFSLVDCATI